MPPERPYIRFLKPRDLSETGTEGFLKTLLCLGNRRLVENACADAKVIAVDRKILPVSVVNPTSRNCDLCSSLTHHVLYARDEIQLRTPVILKGFIALAYSIFERVLRIGSIDKAVIINNWWFSTNPCLELNSSELESTRQFLEMHYPDYAQVVRSIHPKLFADQKRLFSDCGYSLIKSRDVFIWPVNDDSYLARKNYRKDRILLDQSPYEIVEAENMSWEDAHQLRHLYRTLYLEKHNPLNAWLTESFFQSTFRSQILQYHLLKNNEQIIGFYGFCIVRDVFVAVMLGYDLTIPRKEGLYRLLLISCINEAKKRNLTLNLSAGVDSFKASRGGQSIIEYEAVYYKHLSIRQRAVWSLLRLKCFLSVKIRAFKRD